MHFKKLTTAASIGGDIFALPTTDRNDEPRMSPMPDQNLSAFRHGCLSANGKLPFSPEEPSLAAVFETPRHGL
jgi:hypothetical protein